MRDYRLSNSCEEKTIRPNADGVACIELFDTKKGTALIQVLRLSRSKMMKCSHYWCSISRPGHGKWRSGCLKCGALSR